MSEDPPWISLRKSGAAAAKSGDWEEAAKLFKAATEVEQQYVNAAEARDRWRNHNYRSDWEREQER